MLGPNLRETYSPTTCGPALLQLLDGMQWMRLYDDEICKISRGSSEPISSPVGEGDPWERPCASGGKIVSGNESRGRFVVLGAAMDQPDVGLPTGKSLYGEILRGLGIC